MPVSSKWCHSLRLLISGCVPYQCKPAPDQTEVFCLRICLRNTQIQHTHMTHGEEYNIYCNIKQFKSILFQLKLLEVSSRKKKRKSLQPRTQSEITGMPSNLRLSVPQYICRGETAVILHCETVVSTQSVTMHKTLRIQPGFNLWLGNEDPAGCAERQKDKSKREENYSRGVSELSCSPYATAGPQVIIDSYDPRQSRLWTLRPLNYLTSRTQRDNLNLIPKQPAQAFCICPFSYYRAWQHQ